MPPPTPTPPGAPLLHTLERHQRRRAQGQPVLTVLAGPPGSALALWRRWMELHQRPLCMTLAQGEAEVTRAWMEALARARPLEADAADFLGAAAGLASGELTSRLEGKPAHERDVLLQELYPTAPTGDAIALCRGLLQPPGGQAPLEAVLRACGSDALRAVAALHALVPEGSAPGLLLAGQGPGWLSRAARTAARLCEAVPALAVALGAQRPELDAYLRGPESHTLAMVREGRVELESPSAEELRRRLEALGVRRTQALGESLARLAEDGAPDELLVHLGEAARERETAARGEGDGARSEAERFMWRLLDWHPATHGLFELNARADFLLNGRPVEVDFLCRRLRVAIEVDGYYHFQNAQAYRRDRRKDVALQRHGYLVLRFLADDVVERVQEIRDTVLQVLSQRGDAAGRLSLHREEVHGGD